MADVGLDYAGNSPGAAAVKAAGFNFVARYLSRYTSKTIKQPEYDDMTNNGVGVVLVFEDSANQALQGYGQGVADAQVALAGANSLGWPASRPIHFAVDFDINDAQKGVGGEYMKGVISVLGVNRVGAYGGFYWIKYCAENGLASFFWQAVAWSGGQIHASTTLFQRLGGTIVNGTECDINDALKADYGQNNYQGEVEMTDQQAYDEALAIGQALMFSEAEINSPDYYNLPERIKQVKADPSNAAATILNDKLVGYPSPHFQQLFYKAVHYDADLAAAKAGATPAPGPTPPSPTPTPTPSPTPTPPKKSIWQQIKEALFGTSK